ncbi:MAG: hypothetical protein H0V97_06915 [Actinobacteria bacterium]|nr:hypothetical protein [Actinomycetota bacterium]
MPLTKSDNPSSDKANDATNQVLDAGAGAPDAYIEAAEALPEKDDVEKAYKAAMLADTGQKEAQEKLKAVEASPNATDTPSGYALQETAGIADNIERGNEYARIKSAKRWGYVPASESDLTAK